MQKPALWILLAGVAVAGQAALGQAPDAGKQIFDTRCARCHGPEGGGGELGPSIVRGIASRSESGFIGLPYHRLAWPRDAGVSALAPRK